MSEEKKAPAANRGDTIEETYYGPNVMIRRDRRKPVDADVDRFNHSLLAYFRQLRAQLREGR